MTGQGLRNLPWTNFNPSAKGLHCVALVETRALSNFSLYSLYYAEVCNEFARSVSASLRPGNTTPFEMSRRWRAVGNTVSDLTGPRFEPQTSCSRDERVTHDQLAGCQWIVMLLSRKGVFLPTETWPMAIHSPTFQIFFVNVIFRFMTTSKIQSGTADFLARPLVVGSILNESDEGGKTGAGPHHHHWVRNLKRQPELRPGKVG